GPSQPSRPWATATWCRTRSPASSWARSLPSSGWSSSPSGSPWCRSTSASVSWRSRCGRSPPGVLAARGAARSGRPQCRGRAAR
ncbi:unnamed protein product, partial [Prorocentrum cordatum]